MILAKYLKCNPWSECTQKSCSELSESMCELLKSLYEHYKSLCDQNNKERNKERKKKQLVHKC